MADAVIIDAIRTPIGALGGVLASVRPDDLAALVIKAIVERNQLDAALVEEVYFGCANQAGEDNRNVARMAALLAGLPAEVAGVTVNRLCASGLHAVNQAARAIKAGEGDVFIAGGVESMSSGAIFRAKSRDWVLLWQPHSLGYCSRLALPECQDEGEIWDRIDGRDRRKYCGGAPAPYPPDAGQVCYEITPMRNCCNRLGQVCRRDSASSRSTETRRTHPG